MVLKRPYAFLIKHFRLVHLILALPLIYIVWKTHLIVNFFNSYVANSYTYQTGSDISGLYISGFLLFSIFIIIAATLAIYYLLKFKEKPVKWYVFLMIYYIVLFIMLFWYSGIISSMSREILSARSARIYRDISIIIYLPQYIFIVFVVLRAVGFNLKQFNFKSDLRELEISSEDNEEVEVGFEIDGYKTKRFFRRFKREFGYYLVENRLMVTVVVILLIFSSILVYYNTRKSYDISYGQGDTFAHQGFTINVRDSIVTNLTYNGKKIDNRYYYLVLKTRIVNNMDTKAKLSYDSLIINIDGENVTPTLDRSTYFLDYGEPYYGDYIKPHVDKEYSIVYRLNKNQVKKSYKLKVLSSFSLRKNEIVTKYAVVNLTPVNITKVSNLQTVGLNEKLMFNGTNVGNTLLTITDFEKTNSYIYDYEVCYSKDNCTTKKGVASIDYTKGTSTSSLLVLGYDFDLDDTTTYSKYVKNGKTFFDNFATIKSCVEGTCDEYEVINVTPKNLTNKLVLQVNGNITDADDLDLYFTIRNKRFIVNLV